MGGVSLLFSLTLFNATIDNGRWNQTPPVPKDRDRETHGPWSVVSFWGGHCERSPVLLPDFRTGLAAIPAILEGHSVFHGGVDDAFFVQTLHHIIHGFHDGHLAGIHDDFRIFGLLVGGGDAGKVGDLPGTGFFIEALGIAIFADLQVALYEDFDEVAVVEQGPDPLAILLVGGDEGGDDDGAGVGEQLGHLAHPADVLLPVSGGEAEVTIQAVADVVAIQGVGVVAQVEEFLFQVYRQGRFPGAGEAGEPDNRAPVAVAAFPHGLGDFG